MLRKHTTNCVYSLQRTDLELSNPKLSLHVSTDHRPFMWITAGVNTPISNDLDSMLSEQDVNEHAAVVFCIPDSKLAEQINRTLAG